MTVLNRNCYFQRVGGTIRPFEWATITVDGFGHMVELFWPFETSMTALTNKLNDDFSTTNDFQRVDNFIETDEAGLLKALNSGDQDHPYLHGGRHYPRSGR